VRHFDAYRAKIDPSQNSGGVGGTLSSANAGNALVIAELFNISHTRVENYCASVWMHSVTLHGRASGNVRYCAVSGWKKLRDSGRQRGLALSGTSVWGMAQTAPSLFAMAAIDTFPPMHRQACARQMAMKNHHNGTMSQSAFPDGSD